MDICQIAPSLLRLGSIRHGSWRSVCTALGSCSSWAQSLAPAICASSLIFSQHVHHPTEGTNPCIQNMPLWDMSLVQIFHSFPMTKNTKRQESLAAGNMYLTPCTAPPLVPSYSDAFFVCRLGFFCPNSFSSKTWTPFYSDFRSNFFDLCYTANLNPCSRKPCSSTPLSYHRLPIVFCKSV